MPFDFARLYPYDDDAAAISIYEIWITIQGERSPVMEFASELRSDQPVVYKRLRGLLKRTADEGKIDNDEMYKGIGGGVHEFKARKARVYSFDDGRRVVLTHGGTHVDRAVEERKKSLRVRAEYLSWKRRQQ